MKWRWFERALIGVGVALLLLWGGIRLHAWWSSRNAVRRFRNTVESHRPSVLPGEESATAPGGAPVPVPTETPDTSLWARGRIAKYRESLRQESGPAIAVLSIPSIGLTVPVFDGTGPMVLNRGVGRIPGTARPGEAGNLGIAGHRDGFFRGLKDVAPGDTIVLETPRGRVRYEIQWVRIVDPSDVSVLAPSTERELTLVTCYPFYFVGRAPKRFIVRANVSGDGSAGRENRHNPVAEPRRRGGGGQ